jgi:hypothetical protein
MTGGLMSPEQRLRALQELEQRQQRNQRRVVQAVWASIVAGILVLSVIVASATWQLDSLNQQKIRLQGDITALKKQKETVVRDLEQAEQRRIAAAGTLANLPEAQLKQAIEKQLATAPQTAALLPRIYMQIVDRADSAHAQVIRKALQDAGYIVLGIEYVPTARGLETTDVRFYHAAEKGEAEKIAKLLKNAGEPTVSPKYLPQYETSTRVRPNHFEVWLAHHVE